MKPDGVRRSVRSSSREREAGDAPSMGRVARMPGTGLPKLRRKRKVSERSRRLRARRTRKRVIATWTLLIAGIAVACLGVAIWQGMVFKPADEVAAVVGTPLLTEESEKDGKVDKPQDPTLSENDALALVKKALAVRDPAKISEYFRDGDRSAAEKIDFLRKLETVDGRIDHCEWLGSLDTNGLVMDGVLVEFQSTGKPRNRLAQLVPDAAGKWKIDFDAFARTCTPAWSEVIGGPAESAKVRVYVAADSYYNGPFANDRDWLCIGLASPDTEEILYGYCKVGSPQAAAMKWVLSKAEMSRAVLEIRRGESAERRQFVISRVLAEDWTMGDQPFDERFK